MVGTSEFDTVLDLCRAKRRRIVLAVLADERRTLTMDDLTKMIVARGDHAPLRELSDETVTRIKISLYHVHVPKLEAAGFVEYDSDRQLVEPTPEFDQLEPHLSAILDVDPEITPRQKRNVGQM